MKYSIIFLFLVSKIQTEKVSYFLFEISLLNLALTFLYLDTFYVCQPCKQCFQLTLSFSYAPSKIATYNYRLSRYTWTLDASHYAHYSTNFYNIYLFLHKMSYVSLLFSLNWSRKTKTNESEIKLLNNFRMVWLTNDVALLEKLMFWVVFVTTEPTETRSVNTMKKDDCGRL